MLIPTSAVGVGDEDAVGIGGAGTELEDGFEEGEDKVVLD